MSALNRFLEAQDGEWGYETALEEIRSGHKRTHWIWYIFPQMRGLGYSPDSEYYGIASLYEARQYMEHPVLASRLREITDEVLRYRWRSGASLEEIMGSWIDAVKFRSSMTLFEIVSCGEIFEKALGEFFDGERDDKTLSIVEKERAFLDGDSPLVKVGVPGYLEKGYFESGCCEADEVPEEGKLPTFLTLILQGYTMTDMVHHYLYNKDFYPERLSNVESRLQHYREDLLHAFSKQSLEQEEIELLRECRRHADGMDLQYDHDVEYDNLAEVEAAAAAFDYMVGEIRRDEGLSAKMKAIAKTLNVKE